MRNRSVMPIVALCGSKPNTNGNTTEMATIIGGVSATTCVKGSRQNLAAFGMKYITHVSRCVAGRFIILCACQQATHTFLRREKGCCRFRSVRGHPQKRCRVCEVTRKRSKRRDAKWSIAAQRRILGQALSVSWKGPDAFVRRTS